MGINKRLKVEFFKTEQNNEPVRDFLKSLSSEDKKSVGADIMSKMNNAYVGSSFNDFLEEEGIATEVKNEAIKRLISYNLLEEMQKQNINKTEMARKMSTSRAALNRLLNPYNDSVTLATLTKAANVLGKKLILQLR